MPYRFIFSTWFIILPLNMLALILVLFMNESMLAGDSVPGGIQLDDEVLLMIAVFTLPFATPGLFGLMIVVWIAREFIYDAAAQFLFITIACCIITIGCYLLLELVLDLNLENRAYMLLMIASVIAVLATLLFTRRYYFSYLRSHT